MHLHQTGSFHYPSPRHSLEVVYFQSESPAVLRRAASHRGSFQKVRAPHRTPALTLQSFFFLKGVIIYFSADVIFFRSHLYSLDLVGHHHGVLLADLGGGLGLVVVGTVVLVRVPVDAAEQVAAAAVEPWKNRRASVRDTSEGFVAARSCWSMAVQFDWILH